MGTIKLLKFEDKDFEESFDEEIKNIRNKKPFLPPKSEKYKNKKTLLLDLDETLVHSSISPIEHPDIILPININGEKYTIYILKRPGLKDFLGKVSEIFEIVTYTASLSSYACNAIDNIDNENKISFRLYREHCVFNKLSDSYVKDLSCCGRDLKEIIILDNTPSAYLLHPSNGIPISTWTGDKCDKELEKVFPILELLSRGKDVRELIPKIISDNTIEYNKAIDILKKELLFIHIEKSNLGYQDSVNLFKLKNSFITSSQLNNNSLYKSNLTLKGIDNEKNFKIKTKSSLLTNHSDKQTPNNFEKEKSNKLSNEHLNKLGKLDEKSGYYQYDKLMNINKKEKLYKFFLFNTPLTKNSKNQVFTNKKNSLNDSCNRNELESSQDKMPDKLNTNRIIDFKKPLKSINRLGLKKHASLVNFDGSKLELSTSKKKITKYEYYKKKVLKDIKNPENKIGVPLESKDSDDQSFNQSKEILSQNKLGHTKRNKNCTPMRIPEKIHFSHYSKGSKDNIHQIICNLDSNNSSNFIQLNNNSKKINKLSNIFSKAIKNGSIPMQKEREEIKCKSYLKQSLSNVIIMDENVKALKGLSFAHVLKKQNNEIKKLIDNHAIQQIKKGNINLRIASKSKHVLNQPFKIHYYKDF